MSLMWSCADRSIYFVPIKWHKNIFQVRLCCCLITNIATAHHLTNCAIWSLLPSKQLNDFISLRLWLTSILFIYFFSCSIGVKIIHWERRKNKVQSSSVDRRTNKHNLPIHPYARIVTSILQRLIWVHLVDILSPFSPQKCGRGAAHGLRFQVTARSYRHRIGTQAFNWSALIMLSLANRWWEQPNGHHKTKQCGVMAKFMGI